MSKRLYTVSIEYPVTIMISYFANICMNSLLDISCLARWSYMLYLVCQYSCLCCFLKVLFLYSSCLKIYYHYEYNWSVSLTLFLPKKGAMTFFKISLTLIQMIFVVIDMVKRIKLLLTKLWNVRKTNDFLSKE